MFDWLFEGRREIYGLIAVLAVILFLVWWRVRKRNLLMAASAVAALAVAYFVLDKFVETPREQIVRKLHEMADAVKAQDADAIFKHIAQEFRFRNMDRASFRSSVDKVIQGGLVSEVVIYDEEWREAGDDHMRPVEFKAKPKSAVLGDQPAYPVRAKFVREPDGQWRMQSFDVYNPVQGNVQMDLPLP